MSARTRRFFWGNTLGQAVVAAARYFALDPEALAYRRRDKRHGFVRLPRAILIEVDPTAPRLPEGAERPVAAKPPSAPRPTAPAQFAGSAPPAPSERRPQRAAGRSRGGAEEREVWDRPDAEAAGAAVEAVSRLARLAGLALDASVEPGEERLEVRLAGNDEPRLAELGGGFLDELEHLLPRAIHGLTGKLVRVRVEGAGLRAARELALREEARRAAEQVLASGQELLLDPLAPAERRIVHLELEAVAGVRTESLGTGLLKRVRIAATVARVASDDEIDRQFNR